MQAVADRPGDRTRPGTLYLLHVLTHATRSHLDAALAPLGLSSFQCTILSVIARHEGLSSSRLSRRFHVSPQAMGETIGMLERRGLLMRRDDPANRKVLQLFMTAAGKQIAASAETIIGGFEARLFGKVPHADLERLRGLLSAALEELGDRPVRREAR